MVEVSANVLKNNHEQGLGLCIPSGEALLPHRDNADTLARSALVHNA